jgi:predicted Zn-dependent protease
MTTILARYSDGRSAARRDAGVRFAEGALLIEIEGAGVETWRFSDLEAAAPLHKGDREALLTSRRHPDATIFIEDAGAVAALIARAPQLAAGHSRLRAALPGLAVGAVALLLTAVVFIADLSPAKGLARLMPLSVRTSLGDNVVASMIANRPVCRDPSGREALAKLVRRIDPDRQDSAERVTVVDWSLVNAFAAPGGRVVVTRAIIEKAASADELAGVLAHEFGHTEELHPEAGLVRSIGFWTLLNFMFTGQPGTLANAGLVLAQLSYTRGAEREADTIALAKLKAAGISPKPFAGFFRRIAGPANSKSDNPVGRIMNASEILSTHPAPADRIAKIEAVPPYPATPALGDADWQALRRICPAK